jgi:hypothetical protein
MSEHLSDLAFDALATEGRALGSVEQAHLEACAVCRARRLELEQARAEFLARFDVVGLATDALMRSRAVRVPWWRQRWLSVSLAAAAALLLIVLLPLSSSDLHVKGRAPLAEVFVIDGDTRRTMDGAVAPDARLALLISPEGPRHVRILWSSEPKQWTALYPEQGAPAWFLEKPTWLEREVVLDGAPEDEQLGVVACKTTMTHDEAARMAEDEPRSDCEVEWTRIEKR